MNCRNAQKHMPEAWEGTLPARLRTALDNHVQSCTPCAAQWKSTQEMLSALRHMPTLEVPAEIWHRIAAQTTQAQQEPAPRWWQSMARDLAQWYWEHSLGLSGALTAAVALLIVWGTLNTAHAPGLHVIDIATSPSTAIPSYFREHHNPAGQPISDGDMVLAFNTLGDAR